METLHESITKHPFFDGMKPDHLAILVGGVKEVQFRAGDILFREGEPASHFYLIQTGKITVESRKPGGSAVLQTLNAGEVLGWSWLFPPFYWHFQARAVESSHVIMLSGTYLLAAAERDHDFGYELMKRVSQLVISRLQATRKLLLELQVQSALEG
ncbi:MAG: Crp/Fnr family transcriptional regulator [Verrucomicrobiota bacterium]